MTRLASILTVALVLPACGSGDDDGSGPGGKADSPGDLCVNTGGIWMAEANTCNCGFGNGTYILNAGGCVANEVAGPLCENSGGLWTDDASDAYYCVCPEFLQWSDITGQCGEPNPAQLCYETGGTWLDEGAGYCDCGFGNGTFVADQGGCVSDEIAGELCEGSGGEWTDDASDSWYCVCSNGVWSNRTGTCMSAISVLCYESGGTWIDEGAGLCDCGFGNGTFVADLGGCVADERAGELCEGSRGEWTDDAADFWYCICPGELEWSNRSGRCVSAYASLCYETGGDWYDEYGDEYCNCGFGNGTFVVNAGGCIADERAGELCEGSGGEWTDDASDSWYCICPLGEDYSYLTGRCD